MIKSSISFPLWIGWQYPKNISRLLVKEYVSLHIRFRKGANRIWCRWHLDDCKSLFIFYSNFCANSSRAVKSIFAYKIYLSTMYHPVTENKVAFVLRLPLLYNCYSPTVPDDSVEQKMARFVFPRSAAPIPGSDPTGGYNHVGYTTDKQTTHVHTT